MDFTPDITIGSEILGLELYSKSYNEFCESLDELGMLLDDEMYVEEVNDPKVKGKKERSRIIKNTVDTTKDVAEIYNDVTSANGNIIKATWDLVIKCVKICTSVISWMVNKLAMIPKFILNVINKAEQIPDDIRAKIRGDIRIYITVEDIKVLYNNSLLAYLEQFFSQLGILVKGDMWGTFFRRRGDNGVEPGNLFSNNDLKTIKNMRSVYNNISRITFKPTTITMNSQKMIDLYFGKGKNITYTDLKGNTFSGTYLEALRQLSVTLQAKQTILKSLQKDLGDKFDRTTSNSEFGNLHPRDQKQIMESMQMISKVLTITGNLSRYIMEDVKTINTATNTLIKKGKLEKDPNGDKK